MSAFSFLNDDAMVDALLMEVAGLLEKFISHREHGCIDLLGLPLSSNCLSTLELRLGRGEVSVRLDASGVSEIRETGFPGVWWTRHVDEAGRLVAMLIEVAPVPDILMADIYEMETGLSRIRASTSFAEHQAGRPG